MHVATRDLATSVSQLIRLESLIPSTLSLPDRLLAAFAAAILLITIILAHSPSATTTLLPQRSACWSVRLLNRECPGCGLTRSFIALGRGNVAVANILNPLGPILFGALVTLLIITAGKAFAPASRIWRLLDLALLATIAIALIVRSATFYSS
ncbi:MAG TPA: DUF2752 domain-containing protein [Thermoanaerobaculia bacterium]|nr:DUF2752 domain-containing protein [Thermoanaerobaculia bacterium]